MVIGHLVFSIGSPEPFLAGDLVPRVLPERILEGSRFGHRQLVRGGLVSRCRADENILPRPAAEELEVGLDLGGRVGYPFDDRVEGSIPQGPADGIGVANIPPQNLGSRRRRPDRLAAVEKSQLDTPLDGEP